ncbi:hypothetical protein E6P97_02805 [Patescibacteria group bacterium]|nr:MAG: hypothetical protein E6P97_02805 [Patescibacteria group bacterium]
MTIDDYSLSHKAIDYLLLFQFEKVLEVENLGQELEAAISAKAVQEQGKRHTSFLADDAVLSKIGDIDSYTPKRLSDKLEQLIDEFAAQ